MSVIDNALQALFINGCKIKKLWTNASLGSSFAAQTISVSNALDLDFLIMSLATDSRGIIGTYIVFRDMEYIAYGNGAVPFQRTIEWSNNKIIFGVGEILSSGWKTDNAAMKPQTIYGIQLLGGVIHKLKTLAASLFLRREVLA